MEQRIVLVAHSAGETDDRVAEWAHKQGYRLDWRVPAEGQPLPNVEPDIAATVVYGGSYDVHQKSELGFLRQELAWIEQCLRHEVPVLGLCLGGQLLANVLGVEVGKHPEARVEYGYYPLEPTAAGRDLFPDELMVLEAHWEGWFELPHGAEHLARTAHFPQQAFRYAEHHYGFQFHPEATTEMLARWVKRRSPERSSRVGSHPQARQLSDSRRYGDRVGAWLETFLAGWLSAPSRAREVASAGAYSSGKAT